MVKPGSSRCGSEHPVQGLALSWLPKADILPAAARTGPALPTQNPSRTQRSVYWWVAAVLAGALIAGPAFGFAKKTKAPTDPTQAALEATLAGEFALQAGKLEEAAKAYLEAARAAGDATLAERATRIALLAKDNRRAEQSLALW